VCLYAITASMITLEKIAALFEQAKYVILHHNNVKVILSNNTNKWSKSLLDIKRTISKDNNNQPIFTSEVKLN
jgi:hypothetical protein